MKGVRIYFYPNVRIRLSVCRYIHIYLAVYGPEIIGGFHGLEEKSKKNESGLWYRKNKLWWFVECATPL